MTEIFYYTTMSLLVFMGIILMMLILIQKGRGGGLASAFGGVGGHSAFGSKTGDVLTWATAIVFGVFLLLAILANKAFDGMNRAPRPGPAVVTPVGTTGGTAPANTTNTNAPSNGTNAPGSPESSLPQAPITADPGVSNPPPAAPTGTPSAPANPQVQPTTPTTPAPTTR